MDAERRVRKLEASFQRRDREDRDAAMAKLVQSREGRRYLWLLLEECGVFRNPFNGNALVSAFTAGEMNVGQKVFAHLMSVTPEAFTLMQKENVDEHERRKRHLNAPGDNDADDA